MGDSRLIWQRRGYLDTRLQFSFLSMILHSRVVVFFIVVVEAELIARSLLTLKSLLVPFGLNEGMGGGVI